MGKFLDKLGVLSLLSLGLAFFFLAFDDEYRLFVYISLAIFILSSTTAYIIVENRDLVVSFSNKTLTVLSILIFMFFSQVTMNYFDTGFLDPLFVVSVGYTVAVVWGLTVSLNIWGVEWYSIRLCLVIVVLTLISFFLYYTGSYLKSMNFYASMLLIPVMYMLLTKQYLMFAILISSLLSLGIAFGARGAYIVIVLFLLLYIVNNVIKINPHSMIFLLLILITFQLFILSEQSLYWDEMLSYRPTIWNFYYNRSMESFWLGHGPILPFITEDAAIYYNSMIGRGAGAAYGTQSMYLLYFYEVGIVGLMLLFVMLYSIFKTRSKFVIPVLSMSILAFLETVKVGYISTYGLPLTYFIVLSLMTEQGQNK
jgi:hypothetical protein